MRRVARAIIPIMAKTDSGASSPLSRCSSRIPRISAASRSSVCCLRSRRRWSDRLSFSTISARQAFAPGEGVDVRPHPHIGLATVTYLFEGAMMHRDSLGSVQRIEPGDVNWMSAGAGIVHSERTPPEDRASGHRLHGLQTWVALPKAHEQGEPSFSHYAHAVATQDRPGRSDHAPDRGHGVRPALSCADVFADVLCRRGYGGWLSLRSAIPSTRNAASTPSTANSSSPAKRFPPATWRCCEPWTHRARSKRARASCWCFSAAASWMASA